MYEEHPPLRECTKYVSFLSLLLYTGVSRQGHTTPRARKAGKLSVGGKSEKGSQKRGRVSLPSLLQPVIQVMETHERELERTHVPLGDGYLEVFL